MDKGNSEIWRSSRSVFWPDCLTQHRWKTVATSRFPNCCRIFLVFIALCWRFQWKRETLSLACYNSWNQLSTTRFHALKWHKLYKQRKLRSSYVLETRGEAPSGKFWIYAKILSGAVCTRTHLPHTELPHFHDKLCDDLKVFYTLPKIRSRFVKWSLKKTAF